MVPPSSRAAATQQVAASTRPLRTLELAFVAKRYYIEGRSKVEIGDELGISRFRVARMLDDAVANGIVHIEINVSPHIDADLSSLLEQHFDLDRAIVATTSDLSQDEGRLSAASLAAALLAEVLTADDVVGIGGGRTLHHVIEELPPLPACTAVQLIGGVPGVGLWTNSVDLVRLFGERTGGPMHTFLLPYLLNDAQVAERLRDDGPFARAKSLFGLLSVIVTPIGSWDPPRSGLHDLLADDERRALRAKDVAADLLGALIDRTGQIVASDVAARSTGITPPEIRMVPSVIAVAAGTDKADAVRATLRSGLVSTLVTDSGVARLLLRDGR